MSQLAIGQPLYSASFQPFSSLSARFIRLSLQIHFSAAPDTDYADSHYFHDSNTFIELSFHISFYFRH
jgi:hypothetical protein